MLEHAFIESKALLWLWSCETWVTCQGLPPPAHILRGPQTVVKMLQTWPDGWYQKFVCIHKNAYNNNYNNTYIYTYINVSAHSAYILLLNVFDTTRESFQKQKGTKGREVNGNKNYISAWPDCKSYEVYLVSWNSCKKSGNSLVQKKCSKWCL